MATSVVNPRVQFFANNGRPLIGGRIHTYVAGSSTRARTYKDAAKAQPNTNPIILDGRGEAQIYLAEGVEYKFVVEDSKGALIYTQEPVYGAVWPNPEQWPSDATLAYRYMSEAKAAAEAIGPLKFYDTLAQAEADIESLSEGDIVEISRDDGADDARTRRRFLSGGLTAPVVMDQLRLDLASTTGADRVGLSAGGSKWSTVAGFVAFLLSYLGSSVIGFIGAFATSVKRSIQSKLRDTVSVADFMTEEEIEAVKTGNPDVDPTAAIQRALNSGASFKFIEGEYIVGPLNIPYAAAGATYRGEGWWHYGKSRKTRFKPRYENQSHIFNLADGANNISMELMRIDCEDKCDYGIKAEYGSFLSLDAVGVYDAKVWGVYNKQGLARWRRLYVKCPNATGGGAQLYSDGSIECSEFTRGRVPLKLAAGGNRLSNVWANGGDECCLELSPLDTSTNHINTSITNLYVGETLSGPVEKPIIKIQGNASRRVEQVQMAAVHIVCAETATPKINTGIQIDLAQDVTISAAAVLGFAPSTSDKQLKHFLKATNTLNLNVNGGVIRNVAKNVFVIGSGCYPFNLNGTTISEWGTYVASGTEGAAILIDNSASYGNISGVTFDISGSSTVPYAVEGGNPTRWVFDSNFIRYPNATVWSPETGTFAGGYQRLGSQPIPRGQLVANTTYDPPSIAAGAKTTTTVTVQGAALGDAVVAVSFGVDLQTVRMFAWVSAANTVTVAFKNEGTASVDLASSSLRVRVQKLV